VVTGTHGPLPHTVYYARFENTEWAMGTFVFPGTGTVDQPELFKRPAGGEWTDLGDNALDQCGERIPLPVQSAWNLFSSTSCPVSSQAPCSLRTVAQAIQADPHYATYLGGAGSGAVSDVSCADLAGDGQQEAMALVGGGAGGHVHGWLLLAPRSGSWKVVFDSPAIPTPKGQIVLPGDVASVQADPTHTGIVIEADDVYAPGDADCCPSQHATRTYRWNGTTLVPITGGTQ
jgi:hypothetical protein